LFCNRHKDNYNILLKCLKPNIFLVKTFLEFVCGILRFVGEEHENWCLRSLFLTMEVEGLFISSCRHRKTCMHTHTST
jgi:hypothetical protein